MLKYFAEFGLDGIVFSIVQSEVAPVSPNVRECAGYQDLGKKWDGAKFVAVAKPARYKVWSKPQFILTIGKTAFDSIVDGADKDLRFAKYVLDSADSVDMNVPEYVALVDLLRAKNIITAAQLTALKVLE